MVERPIAKSYDDIDNTFTVPRKKSKIFFFASSIIKNITLLFAPFAILFIMFWNFAVF